MPINLNEERLRVKRFSHGVVNVVIQSVKEMSINVKGENKDVLSLDVLLIDCYGSELNTPVMIFRNLNENSPYVSLLESTDAQQWNELSGVQLVAKSYKSGNYVNLVEFRPVNPAPSYDEPLNDEYKGEI